LKGTAASGHEQCIQHDSVSGGSDLIQERISGPDTLLKLYAAIDDRLKLVQRQLGTKHLPRDLRGGRPELSA